VTRAETVGERRAEIITAAIRVLARDGIAETTTRKIATEASVNLSMLRYYFGSKDDLLFAVLEEMMQTTREIVRKAAATHHELRQAIADSLTAFWTHVEQTPELQVMQYELTLYALRNPDSAWLAKQQYDGYTTVIATLFEEAYAAAGQTCNIPFSDLARFVIGGLDGLILQFISDRDPERARHDLSHLIHAVITLAERVSST
jgi:AcrR family transcriptional regulator